jgi:hypothetical protein
VLDQHHEGCWGSCKSSDTTLELPAAAWAASGPSVVGCCNHQLVVLLGMRLWWHEVGRIAALHRVFQAILLILPLPLPPALLFWLQFCWLCCGTGCTT